MSASALQRYSLASNIFSPANRRLSFGDWRPGNDLGDTLGNQTDWQQHRQTQRIAP